jgi:hypothetical protein
VEKHNTKRELNSDQQDSDQKMAVVGRIRRNRSREKQNLHDLKPSGKQNCDPKTPLARSSRAEFTQCTHPH